MHRTNVNVNVLDIVDKYKYLRTVLNEHLNFTVTADALASAGGRTLSSVISKFSTFINIGYTTFTKLFESSVTPILDYGSEVWVYKNNVKCERVHQRAERYYSAFIRRHPY